VIDQPDASGLDEHGASFLMSLMALYRNPERPDEAGMTVVADEANATAVKGQLENRGFLVLKIEIAPFAKTTPMLTMQPQPRRR
jgi:hypothetical protein